MLSKCVLFKVNEWMTNWTHSLCFFSLYDTLTSSSTSSSDHPVVALATSVPRGSDQSSAPLEREQTHLSECSGTLTYLLKWYAGNWWDHTSCHQRKVRQESVWGSVMCSNWTEWEQGAIRTRSRDDDILTGRMSQSKRHLSCLGASGSRGQRGQSRKGNGRSKSSQGMFRKTQGGKVWVCECGKAKEQQRQKPARQAESILQAFPSTPTGPQSKTPPE